MIGNKASLYNETEILVLGTEENNSSIYLGDSFLMKAQSIIHCKEGNITIGNNCALGKRAEIICEKSSVTVGDYTRIAAEVFIVTNKHKFDKTEVPIHQQGREHKPVTIGNDVWIGRRAMIMPGVTVGNGCVIAAGAVVTKNIEPFSVVAGVPANVIGSRLKKPD